MKTNLISLLFAVLLLAPDYEQKPSQPQSNPQPVPVVTPAERQTPVPSQTPAPFSVPTPSGLIVKVSAYRGEDLGARINAADKALGQREGWILVDVQGEIKTQIHINPGHKLKFAKGRYVSVNFGRDASVILLEGDTAVYGSGMNETVLVESENSYVVIASAGASEQERGYGGVGVRANIRIAGLTIEGRNIHAEGGVRSTVQLGNAHNVRIRNVTLRDTTCLGISAGGDGHTGKYAEDWVVEDCVFEGVASQNLNVVNGQRIIFRRNKFLRAGKLCAGGQPCEGVTAIDVEPNNSTDHARDIIIEDILIDSSDSPFLHGNGIVIQNGARCDFGNVIVRRVKILGFRMDTPAASRITSGIFLMYVNDVTLSDNEIFRAAHSGIRIENSVRVTAERNTLVATGTGGILSFEVKDTTDSQFNFNSVQPQMLALGPYGGGWIAETGKSDRNTYRGNKASRGVEVIGKQSRVIN
jgi:parallel beta-helix repeat protein